MRSFFKEIKGHQGWLALNFPLFIMTLLLIFDASYWKSLTSWSGYCSVVILCVLLFLNPLRALLPTSKILRELNKYRRSLGVATFNYALLHVVCYMVKRGGFFEMLKWLVHPIILPGLIAFLIFIPLAITSNKVSLKTLKFPKWKKLHTKVYIAQWGVLFHMLTQRDETSIYGTLLFIPLFVLQYRRRYRRKKVEQKKVVTDGELKRAA